MAEITAVLEILKRLDNNELSEFKLMLQSEEVLEDFQTILKGRLDGADRIRMAELM